jgi:hypothetical protein
MPLPRRLRRRIVPAILKESDNATPDTYSDNAIPDANSDQLVWPRRFKQSQPAANKPVNCRSVLSGVFTTHSVPDTMPTFPLSDARLGDVTIDISDVLSDITAAFR